MKKSLSNLLRNLEKSQTPSGDANISSLNDILSKALKKGGYDTTNTSCCGLTNYSCYNLHCCSSNTNAACMNDSCG